MNRKEMLRLLLNQAQFNGFEFRRWFQTHVHRGWPGAEEALSLLSGEGRHFTLLFSHEFALEGSSRIAHSPPEPAKALSRKFPVKVTTCPFREVEVKEVLPSDTEPFKPMTVC